MTTKLVRLHITPLTPEIASSLLPPSLLSDLKDHPISYHTIPTFPENNYGYVDVPVEISEKLRKKLNGATFRGVKVKVQEAKPRKKLGGSGGEADTQEEKEQERRKREKKERKRKKEDKVYEGVELPDGRWVKRAWTKVPVNAVGPGEKVKKDKRKREEVKKGECLFKVRLPENIPDEDVKSKKRKRGDKEDDGTAEKKKKKDKEREKTVIKEFKNSTKFPQFLKSAGLSGAGPGKAKEFVEGAGWVDETGVVVDDTAIKKNARVEAEKQRLTEEASTLAPGLEEGISMKDQASSADSESEKEQEEESDSDASKTEATSPVPAPSLNAKQQEMKDSESDSGSGSGSESSGNDEEEEAITQNTSFKAKTTTLVITTLKKEAAAPEQPKAVLTSSDSEASSDGDDESDQEEDPDEEEASEGKGKEKEAPIPRDPIVTPRKQKPTHSTPPSLKLNIPPSKSKDSDSKKPHPLEALFKPSVTSTSALSGSNAQPTGFQFALTYGDSDDEMEDNAQDEFYEPNVPQTPTAPYNRYRSAAPTPDTAIGTKLPPWHENYGKTPEHQGFEPMTPIPPRKLTLRRSMQQNLDVPTDAPLLFPHSESRFLSGMSIWASLPTPKALTERVLVEGQEKDEPEKTETINEKKDKKKKKKKKKKEREANATLRTADVLEKGMAKNEIWKERFYSMRGEWNRDYKRRRRESLKLARRKKRKSEKEAATAVE